MQTSGFGLIKNEIGTRGTKSCCSFGVTMVNAMAHYQLPEWPNRGSLFARATHFNHNRIQFNQLKPKLNNKTITLHYKTKKKRKQNYSRNSKQQTH